ncbi:oligosaccharide flippase family protein [Pontixanthobacter aquaemixtae]|nr:oligosaccharide flippase family protein [Pontixanthobacter aquaemixtae]
MSLGVLRIASMALTLLVGILLARQLGAADYGIYALAMAVVTFTGVLTEFGLPLLAMREFASADAKQNWGEVRGLVKWADRFILTISAIIVGGFLAAALIWDFAKQSVFLATMMWAIVLVPIVAIAKFRGLALLSLGHTFAGQFAVLVLRPGLFVVALAVLWVSGSTLGPAEAMAWQFGAAFAALLCVLGLYLRYRPAAMLAAKPVNRWREWISATIPMGMTEGLRLLQAQLAIVLLGVMMTSADAGLFRVADASAMVGLVFISIVNVVCAPHLARLFAEQNLAELQRLLGVVAFAMTFVVGVVTVIVTPFAGPLMSLVFGSEFAASASPLVILLVGNTIACLFGPVSTLCNMTGLEKHVTVGSALAVVAQLASALVLIPLMGLDGAAISVVIGMLLWRLFLTVKVRQIIGIDPGILATDFRYLADALAQYATSLRSKNAGTKNGNP